MHNIVERIRLALSDSIYPVIKAPQIFATALLAAIGLLHLSTFVVHVPGVSLVSLFVLLLSIAMAIGGFGSLFNLCYFKFHNGPHRAAWGLALMAEIRERRAAAEAQILSYFTRKWSALLGSAAGYMFLNGLFCLLLFGASDSRPKIATADSQANTSKLQDRYLGRFLSGTAIFPATLFMVAAHVVLPGLITENRQSQLGPEDLKAKPGKATDLQK
jgi:hypothetical protein